MLFNNNPFAFVVVNPISHGLFIQYFVNGAGVPPPPGDNFWVEDESFDQMVSEDLTMDYIFVGA